MQTITTISKTKKSNQVKSSPEDRRFKVLDLTMKRNQYRQDALIEILHKAQEVFGYLSPEVLLYVARGLKLPLSRVYGVATFYHLFSLKPKGEHTCIVCLGTACYVKGASTLIEALEQETNLHPEETTANGKVSLMTARCIGACGIGPAAVFDGKVWGHQTPESVVEKVKVWLEK